MLKPVDLHTILPRSFEIQRVEQSNQSRSSLAQHEFAKEMLHQSEKLHTRVQQGNESSESHTVKSDDQSQSKNGNRRYRRFNPTKTAAAQESEELLDQERGQHIDIKI